MERGASRRAWLLMVAGDGRGHGGNTGYDDRVDAYYSYDSEVQNYKNVQVGDVVVLWDKNRLLGVSVIETIKTGHGTKQQNHCPKCGHTRIGERTTAALPWHCSSCKRDFLAPRVEFIEVNQFTARYDAAWASLDVRVAREEITSFQVKRGSFNSIREIYWEHFSRALVEKGLGRAVDRVEARVDLVWPTTAGMAVEIPQGFTQAWVRVRRGQRQFRERTLAAQGAVCAFTGAAPDRVLEAGHLYSYAELGTHTEHGGLMLRRDIHRLFDDGELAVDPSTLRIDVDPALATFPQYARLHGESLMVRLRDQQMDWLGKHWDEHRATR